MKRSIQRNLTFLAALAILADASLAPRANACVGPPIVFFAPGSAELSEASKAILDWAAHIFQMSEEPVMVTGHADRVGRPDRNMVLSRLRAEAVRDFLVFKGISPGRIQVEYFGETRPLVDTADEVPEPNDRNVSMWVHGWCGPPPTP